MSEEYPLENQIDIIHVFDGGHFALIGKDEKNGILLYQCTRCSLKLMVGQYFEPEAEPEGQPEAEPEAEKPKRKRKKPVEPVNPPQPESEPEAEPEPENPEAKPNE